MEVTDLIKSLLLIRRVEEEICMRYGTVGDHQNMRCPVHLSIGQESVAVGVCSNLNNEDKIYSNHRCHAHYLAKGGNLSLMMKEIYGKKGGCLDGRGGSMHLMDPSAGVMMSIPIVASAIPIAVGNALAEKIDRTGSVVAVFFGDGAAEEGVFHESLNFAAVQKLPIIFVCENNLYSVYTHISKRQPNRPLEILGKAHGIASHRLIETDALKLNKQFGEIISDARELSEPQFVVIDTYRSREHCGINYDDHLGYRNPEETTKWLSIDPVQHTCENAIAEKKISIDELNAIEKHIGEMITKSFEDAEQASLPSPKMAKLHLYGKSL